MPTCQFWPRQLIFKIRNYILTKHINLIHVFLYINLQLKVDEFESNVNEIKDPFPPADFPGETRRII